MFITNIDQNSIHAGRIINLYRLRWQIEIIFKIWKSHYQIHTIKKMKPERMLIQLYGRIILIIMNTMIATSVKIKYWNDYGIEVSDYTLHKFLLNEHHIDWLKEQKGRVKLLERKIILILHMAGKYARKSIKKQKNSSFQKALT